MSVRELSIRIFQSFWRGVRQKEIIGKQERGYKTLEVGGPGERPLSKPPGVRGENGRRRSTTGCSHTPSTLSGGGRSYSAFSSVRRALVDNVLRRVTNSQAAILRRKAAHQLTSLGNSAPFLALVGVSLASGSGILTKEDEIEGVCYEIRQAVGKTRLLPSQDKLQERREDPLLTEIVEGEEGGREEHQEEHKYSLQDFHLGKPIAKGCSAVVYSAGLKTSLQDAQGIVGSTKEKGDQFPFAIKMMFNYHAESNAFTILRAMKRETVPARSVSLPAELAGAASSSQVGETRTVPPHPNIVEMLTVFADKIPGLPGDRQLYGDALPARLNPSGCGRNMSLFLVMRRYDCSLRKFLSNADGDISTRTALVLFTQLLEGVAFLSSAGVAHRDLKSDNLLLDLSGGAAYPRLVISDFGCCLADTSLGLRLPYRTYDTDKGGNAALMAPEVASATPGTFTNINYDKADLWTAGTLAYEIFGLENPFYSTGTADNSKYLDSRTYSQVDLPPLPSAVPPLVASLVSAILARNPRDRPSPRQAATTCQLLLWAPSHWYRRQARVNRQQILEWLLTITTKVLCESRWGNTESALMEYQLVATFLATLSLADIRLALDWIQGQLEED